MHSTVGGSPSVRSSTCVRPPPTGCMWFPVTVSLTSAGADNRKCSSVVLRATAIVACPPCWGPADHREPPERSTGGQPETGEQVPRRLSRPDQPSTADTGSYPSHSPKRWYIAVAACSSSRNMQQFPTCGLSTMNPPSLVTNRLVNPAAPCAVQVVMTTRRLLFRVGPVTGSVPGIERRAPGSLTTAPALETARGVR